MAPCRTFARQTGFAVVVTSSIGDLLAYGNGIPPDLVQDAAGAEAWAFAVVLCWNPVVLDATTDCLNIVRVIEAGRAAAIIAISPLARVWFEIYRYLDDMDGRNVRWMPPHGTQHSTGKAARSNGERVTALDWRANRLVDLLGKTVAMQHKVPVKGTHLIEVAAEALEISMAKLGAVIYAASHCPVAVTHEDGTQAITHKRDSIAARPSRCGGTKRKWRCLSNEPEECRPSAACITVSLLGTARPHAAVRSAKRRALGLDCARKLAFRVHWQQGRPILRPAAAGSLKALLEAVRARVAARTATRHYSCGAE